MFLRTILFITSLLSGTVHAQTINTDWPQLQHDAQHSGYISDTYGGPFKILWCHGSTSLTDNTKGTKTTFPCNLPSTPPVSVRVQPVIAYNKVYLPSDDGKLYAYDANTGTLAWSYATNGPLVDSAAVDNSTTQGTVYFGSTDNNLYAVNATTGTLQWKFATQGKIRVTPVYASGVVYTGSDDGNIYAINSNGSLKWQQAFGQPILENPALLNGTLYVGDVASRAYALNSSTGQILWTTQLNGGGFRDRWVVAGTDSSGHDRAFFQPTAFVRPQGADAALLGGMYTSPWSTQRTNILNYLATNPYRELVYVLDGTTGVNTIPPILYFSGSHSEHPQPVVLPNGNFNVLYRYTEGLPNPGCADTCNFWSLYLGEFNAPANDITQLDHWGGTTYDTVDGTKKAAIISDESSALMRSGNIIYVDFSRGTFGFNTTTSTIQPFITYNSSSGGVYYSPPVMFYPNIPGDGWVTPYPGAEIDSDGNDFKRPTPIANGIFYVLHNSVLVAVQGTKQ